MTINARDLGNPLNINLLFDLIEKSDCDICLIQETLVSSDQNLKIFSRRWLGRSYWNPAIGRQGGVAVLVSPKCMDEIVSWKKDSNGHVLSILIRVDGADLNVVNIYAPTNLTDRKSFYNSLHELFIPASALIIGGDFNSYDNANDKFGGNVSVGSECGSLKADFVLVDAWRKLHPRAREFTWFNHNYSIASRLDKFFVSKDLFTPDCRCEISPCPLSDHDFVSFVFQIPEAIKRGPGVWKFNNSLLEDKHFCAIICDLIQSHIFYFASFPSPQDWWEFLKVSIKEESISYSRKKRRQLCRDRVFYTNKLISLRQRLVDGDNSVVNTIQDIESHLKAIYTKEIEGILIRSRAEWLEEGERPTRYFFQLQSSLENIPGMAIFIDFRKAFDSVDWNFLAKVLEAFNFGPQIRKWIRTFYTDISSCVINNGYTSEFFNLQRGVRQGCPLSGILFVLCVEILAQAIRNNTNIKGIQIYNKKYEISQYADDISRYIHVI